MELKNFVLLARFGSKLNIDPSRTVFLRKAIADALGVKLDKVKAIK